MGLPVYPPEFYCLLPSKQYQLPRLSTFETITFIIRFRLACFAVYASSSSLPPTTQDSLPDRAGYSFLGRTLTCKTRVAFPGALGLWTKSPQFLNAPEIHARIVAVPPIYPHSVIPAKAGIQKILLYAGKSLRNL